MRLIDADELLEHIKTWYCDKCDSNNGVRCGSCLMDNALIEIDRHEVVDAVPVVRCKDCMHDGLSTCAICYIENKTLAFINHDPDFYCAYGERKEETDGRD